MRNSKTKWGQTTLKPLMALGGCPRILLKKLSSFNKKLGKNMDRPPQSRLMALGKLSPDFAPKTFLYNKLGGKNPVKIYSSISPKFRRFVQENIEKMGIQKKSVPPWTTDSSSPWFHVFFSSDCSQWPEFWLRNRYYRYLRTYMGIVRNFAFFSTFFSCWIFQYKIQKMRTQGPTLTRHCQPIVFHFCQKLLKLHNPKFKTYQNERNFNLSPIPPPPLSP